jgi:ABC-type sugar transport system permease subunit
VWVDVHVPSNADLFFFFFVSLTHRGTFSMSKRDTFDTGPDIREAIDLTEFTEALVRLANVRFAMSDEYLGTVVTRCRWTFLFCCVSVKQVLLLFLFFAAVFW